MEVLIVPFDSSLSAACWWLLEVWFTASSLLWLPRSRRFIRSCLQVGHLPCGPRVSFVTRVRVEKGCMALVAWISRRNSLEWRCLPQRLLRLTLPWPDWLFPVDMGRSISSPSLPPDGLVLSCIECVFWQTAPELRYVAIHSDTLRPWVQLCVGEGLTPLDLVLLFVFIFYFPV